MKRVLLVMVVSAVLVTLGFAQAPAASSNTDPANVKGCLGGSDGNYTVAENETGQTFKITTSSVDLKPHLGHDVTLMGHKASGDVSSGAADNTLAVTELGMISEHCAAVSVPPVATVSPSSSPISTPPVGAATSAAAVNPSSAPASTPAVAAAIPPTASPSSELVSTPAVGGAIPDATVSPTSAPINTPAVEAAAPVAVGPSSAPASTPAVAAAVPATASPSSEVVSTPAVDAAVPTRPLAHARKKSARQLAAATEPAVRVSPSSEPVTPPAAETATAVPTASPAPEPANPPVAVATAPTATHKGSLLWLLILFVVLVVALGTLAPLLGRWRKRKILERTGTPNLSFTNEVSSDQDKRETRKAA
jgi:hypothetical protein